MFTQKTFNTVIKQNKIKILLCSRILSNNSYDQNPQIEMIPLPLSKYYNSTKKHINESGKQKVK